MAECNCGVMSGIKFPQTKNLFFIFFVTFIFLNLNCVVDGKSVLTDNQGGKGAETKRYLLAKDETCANDVQKHCSNVKKENNFEVFICLQNAVQKDEDELSDECHETLWHYKYNITTDPKSEEAAFKFCEAEVNTLEECKHPSVHKEKGFLMNCLVEHRQKIKDPKCRTFINKMAAVVFSDYRLIKGFYDSCVDDVRKLNCGQLSQPEDKEQHEQVDVVSCLEARFDEVNNEKCKKAVIRIVEMQSDDYHLDRPLFYACQNAREKFCHDVKSGEGRVYECLLNNMNQELMDEECAKKLLDREKMMQKDVKVNYPLWKACEADYAKYKCADQRTDNLASEHGEASLLLMCLQKEQAEGQPISQGCQAEMRSFAILVFEQYQVSPIIVAKCDSEIKNHCSHLVGKEKDDGAMMDCLMTLAASGNNTMSDHCFTAVAEVLKETGAADNYKVDHALQIACESSIAALCDGKQDSMVLSCLMDNAHHQKMQPQCAEQVFHLQYFLSRDFRLDSALYRDCRNDAEKICHANKWGDEKEANMPDSFVISCLYRNTIIPKDNAKVSQVCSEHVKRVMHQRATDIRLMPEIETPCMADLGKLCAENSQEGEEIECLQNNYEQLTEKCKKAIKEFTEMEAKDFDLDRHLVDKCGSMVTKFCEQELKDKDGERILPCLISHKNDLEMDHLCASAIEHWQLIEMKDIEFSPKLKTMCHEDVIKLCKESKSKFEAVKCLSQKIVEDFTKVSDKCRKQIKQELAIQSENIQLNPELFHACKADIDLHCIGVPPGGAQIEECLRRNFPKLKSEKCKKLLMGQEEMESKDGDLDYRLMHVCRPMIKKFCQPLIGEDPRHILECLRMFTHEDEMDEECKKIIVERQKEQASSFKLDAELSNFCADDVEKHCKKEMDQAQRAYIAGHPDQGIVFGCLVDIVVEKTARLKPQCEKYVRKREREAALELDLNPQFMEKCRAEIDHLCQGQTPEDVIDCMKINIPKIKSKGCVDEVRKLIAEGVEDVHVDPFLEEACARDINTYCKDLPRKSGNVVFCLIDVHKAKNLHLQPSCDNFMAKRIKLYSDSKVNLAAFDSVSAVMDAISVSPHRNYIYMTVLAFLTLLFIGGILFGRFSKRVAQEIKNR